MIGMAFLFGVRRQSKAAAALWLFFSTWHVIQSAAAALLWRRTPKIER